MSQISKELKGLKQKIASVNTDFLTKDDKSSFTSFCWHSCVGIDAALTNSKRCVASLPIGHDYVKRMFVAAGRGNDGKDQLIHRTKHCIWKMSADNSHIEPLFASDILSLEDLGEDISTIENEA